MTSGPHNVTAQGRLAELDIGLIGNEFIDVIGRLFNAIDGQTSHAALCCALSGRQAMKTS
jgi:hypothetical protein